MTNFYPKDNFIKDIQVMEIIVSLLVLVAIQVLEVVEEHFGFVMTI